jgi:RNA polymerase sigma factor (sigma-70 family)
MGPVIERLAMRRGLQTADAEDLVQQVMISISSAMEKRPHDPQRAKFRTWLHRVAENAILNALTRRKPDRGSGRTDFLELLAQHSAPAEDSALLRREYKEQVFRWAADRIRQEFADDTWEAFWSTAVKGEDCEVVAQRLSKSVGSVYAARSRVLMLAASLCKNGSIAAVRCNFRRFCESDIRWPADWRQHITRA